MAQVALCIVTRSPLASLILPVLFCHGASPFPTCSDWPRFAWSRPPWESHGGDAGCTGARWWKCGSTRWLWRDGPRNGDGHRSDCTFHGDDGAGNGNGTYADNDHNGRAHDGCNARDASNDHNGGASDGGAGNDALRPRDGIFRRSASNARNDYNGCTDHGRNASDASVWRRIIRRSTSHGRNGCDAILWRRIIRGRTANGCIWGGNACHAKA